jgi:hypothetical protein
MNPAHMLSDTAKHWIDGGAVIGLVATLAGWLPGITALLVLVWTCLRIFESLQNIRINNRKLRGRE